MRHRLLLVAVLFAVTAVQSDEVVDSAGLGAPPPGDPGSDEPRSNRVEGLGNFPLSFEPNRGQADAEVAFLSRGHGYTLLLSSTEAVLLLAEPRTLATREPTIAPVGDIGATRTAARRPAVLRMKFLEANSARPVRGIDELRGKANYFIGNDPRRWHTDIPTFARVKCENIYPGVDVVYYGHQGQLEYDLMIGVGAELDAVRMQFEGADDLRLDADGNLAIEITDRRVVLRAPKIYQEISGTPRAVSGSFVMDRHDVVGIKAGQDERGAPLLVDPMLSFSTYLGGSGTEVGRTLATDAEGNVYVGGVTNSPGFATIGAPQDEFAGFVDGFVSKISPDGSTLIYSTYLGGDQSDQVLQIDVDAFGNAYMTGFTGSNNFPTANAIQQDSGGVFDAFVTKLDPTGSTLLFSTYLGGPGNDNGLGLSVDDAGYIHVAGSAGAGFPTINAIQDTYGGRTDSFAAKLTADGDQFVYSTYLGGSELELGGRVASDSLGNAYVAASTRSTDFPIVNAIQPSMAGNADAFVSKLSPDGSMLLYSTYLGGSGLEDAIAIAADSEGNAYVAGRAISSDFPTFNAWQPEIVGSRDAFVSKIKPDGSGFIFSTYLGGSGIDFGGGDYALDVTADAAGNAYVAGLTNSTDFPTAGAFQESLGGGACGFGPQGPIPCTDGFVSKFSPDGSTLIFSSYLGGSNRDEAKGLAVDATGNIFVTGLTYSRDFPLVGPLQGSFGGGSYDAFLAKVEAPNRPPVANAGGDGRIECTSMAGTGVMLDGSGSTDPDSTPGTNDDIVLMEWFEDFGLSTEVVLGVGETLDVTLPLGGHLVTLQVTDTAGQTNTDDVLLTIEDTTMPNIEVALDPSFLWPPNHRMIDVEATVVATDECSPVSVVLTSVGSNEADNGEGDGNTVSDIQGHEPGTLDLGFALRAERVGNGKGRIYTARYTAVDSAGNASSASGFVVVPHDQEGLTVPIGVSLD